MWRELNPKVLAVGIGATFVLNVIWENAQAPMYEGHTGFLKDFWMCSLAAASDVAIVGALYLAFALLFRDVSWYRSLELRSVAPMMFVAAAVAVAIEKWALDTGRRRYSGMPLVPILDVGLMPVLQMMIIPVLALELMKIADRGAV